MSGRTIAAGLACAILVTSGRAHAGEHATSDIVVDDTKVQLDVGGGVFQPNLASTTFTTIDTWSAQYTTYHATGASLGFTRPMGWLMNATAHVYPFSFRAIGLVATAEFGGFTGNTTTATSPFGVVDPTNNSYWSVLAGPEAQLRLGTFIARAAVLGGGRYEQIDDYTAFEWRIAVRGQVDWVLGDVRRGDVAFTLGVFGGADVFPALGWSSGLSLSVAFL